VEFEAVWDKRRIVAISDGVVVALPAIDDLILTKQFAARPKDLEDIRLLDALRSRAER
jgi:hypothetical protein